jgi:hypothetical protein
MNIQTIDRLIRRAQASALIGLPIIWLLMFALHFRSLTDFLVLRTHYVPIPAADKVTHLIAAKNQWPMIHDPHLLGYLSLPLVTLAAFGLYFIGRTARPLVAVVGLAMTITGTIFLGGNMGFLTAITRGLGTVDPRYLDGAIATFTAVTAEEGAYGLTRSLSMLVLLGMAVQVLAPWNALNIPRWTTATSIAGCLLFLTFWDVDNLMFVGTLCLLLGFIPIAQEIRRRTNMSAADTEMTRNSARPTQNAT